LIHEVPVAAKNSTKCAFGGPAGGTHEAPPKPSRKRAPLALPAPLMPSVTQF